VKRLIVLCLTLLGAGLFAAVVLAEDTPPPTTTGTTTTVPTTTTTEPLIAAGVTIAGVDVGGLTTSQAVSAVLEAFNAPVILRLDRTTISIVPRLLGIRVSADTAVARALTVAPYSTLTLRAGYDKAKVKRFVNKLATRFNRKPESSRLLLRALRPFVTKPVLGRKLDVGAATSSLADQLVHGTRRTIVLKAKLIQPEVTPLTIGPIVVIKRGSNLLTLYNGMKVMRRFQVATGQSVYPTPLGRFEIVVKWTNPWWYPPNSEWAKGEKPVPPGPSNPLGTRWMGLSAPGVGIHGTPNAASIGYSLSHGCIRMLIPQAEWLFEHVNVGTPVFIVSA
jgi:lipoprotein-anchoring transpeptidase ErfK/SrfK